MTSLPLGDAKNGGHREQDVCVSPENLNEGSGDECENLQFYLVFKDKQTEKHPSGKHHQQQKA